MSSDEEAGPVARTIDTVTPEYFGRPDTEMHAIGLLIGGLLVLGLLPLLPFLVVYLVVDRLVGFLRRQTAAPEEPESAVGRPGL